MSKENFQKNRLEWITTKNKIIAKNSGLSKWFFNWFSKRKYSLKLMNTIEHLNRDLDEIIKEEIGEVSLKKYQK